MHFKKITVLLFLFITCFSCKTEMADDIQPQIIPAPNSQIISDGFFELSAETKLISVAGFEYVAEYWKNLQESVFGNISGNSNSVSIIFDDTLKIEQYILEITNDKIIIKARSDKGAFYAIQSLLQLLPPEFLQKEYKSEVVKIQNVTIKDQPQFAYRGMHLDVSRHMFPVKFIKKYIDAMAMLKMNTFHWHLTDDQGWRVEIKKYPKLNEISSYRNETLIGHYNDQPQQFDGKKYGGFYTQDEIMDVVAYAKSRMITVIPEIEMPGHSQAVIVAYPKLGCTGEEVEVATKWGVFEDIFCTKDETFDFLEDVLDEVIALFPSKYIHIGGDEAPKTRWKTCDDCQARIKSEGLKDEHELQNYFITRMEKYLNSKGRQIIGWDEILEGGLAPNATVMSWRGTNGAVEAAKSGHNVIMTPTSHAYFDYYQSDNEDEPTAIGGYLPLEKVYDFNPIPEELNSNEAKFITGVQGNIWTEYMSTEKQVEYMMFPRILAMSEVAWSKPESRNYEDFVTRVENFHERLDALDINYANHLYEVKGEMISENNKSFYKLSTLTKGKEIRYTLDGSEPTLNSEEYKNKIPVSNSLKIKAAVFNAETQLGQTFTQNINYHKAVGAKITIDKKPHKAYSGSGEEGLINGISGSDSRYGDKEWLGFWGDDIEITIEFDKPQKIDFISTRFYNGNGQWIYAPEMIDLKFVDHTGIVITDKIKLLSKSNKNIIDLDYKFYKPKNLEVLIKSFNLKIPNYGTIPEGKKGASNNAWTFIDEIIIN